jgi:hypothetical protein
MSGETSRASRDAVEAARQSETYAVVLAALRAAQQPAQGNGCGCHHGHQAARPRRSTGQVLAITAGICAACTAAAAVFLAVAVTAVAVSGSALVFLFVIRELCKGR